MVSVCTNYFHSILKSETEGRDLSDQEHTNQNHGQVQHDDKKDLSVPSGVKELGDTGTVFGVNENNGFILLAKNTNYLLLSY